MPIGTVTGTDGCPGATNAGSPRVAFQGEAGAFSEEAAQAFFPREPIIAVPRPEFADVAAEVLAGAADFGVLPAENSIHGSVTGCYDVLAAGELVVVDETVLRIRLCLLGAPGTDVQAIRRVMSHPVALAQCRRFLAELAEAEAVAVYDTAGAAKEVAARADPTVAAVASRAASVHYGLAILAADIEDRPDNQTRFYLVAPASGQNLNATTSRGTRKALLMIEAAHRPGSLVAVLTPFARHGVNLTHIESRPADRAWSYRFFLAVAADEGTALDRALADARAEAERVIVLGVYPRRTE
ncbi:MAG: prephenate dehydratase [Longimicrobiales bacterium]